MFIYFIAQTVASLLERELRLEMQKVGLEKLHLLPEGRPTRTPTTAQILDRFEHRARHRLLDRGRLLKNLRGATLARSSRSPKASENPARRIQITRVTARILRGQNCGT